MDSDRFPPHYFIFHESSIFYTWGPPKVFQKFFCLHSICCPYRSIEQDMLVTNITFFFNISRIMRDSLSIFERRKNQFLVQKSINTGIQFIENTLI